MNGWGTAAAIWAGDLSVFSSVAYSAVMSRRASRSADEVVATVRRMNDRRNP